VIHLARARQHHRRQRIAQATTDTIAPAGKAAAGLPPRSRRRTSQPRHHRHGPPGPGPGPAGLTGINALGWGCSGVARGIAPDGRHAWATCSDGIVFELDAATGVPVRILTGPGYRFKDPAAIAADGARVWVTNDPDVGRGSVTELDAATGAPVRVLTGPGYGFIRPGAIAVDGACIWVANAGSWGGTAGGSVTELNAATGAPIRVLTGPSYPFDDPLAIAADGTRVWVANHDGYWVTEFPASSQ
jgi:DNA-binding beta-propeller fold protein YncE